MVSYSPEDSFKISAKFLRENAKNCKPHLVILGAGASIQAFPDGDLTKLPLPNMNNLIELIGLKEDINKFGIKDLSNNFEEVYSQLYKMSEHRNKLKIMEQKIHGYFANMIIPSSPTLYDHLLLSLTSNDLVATFNWDPLLFDAWERLSSEVDISHLPSIAYLHGNVRVGYCPQDNMFGRNGRICSSCNEALKPTPLLYPVPSKSYNNDIYIRDAWDRFYYVLENAFAVTIFGYGAPISDAPAISIMNKAWKGKSEREFETFNIIDIKTIKEVKSTWKKFIFSNHCKIHKDFYDSCLPRFARRSIEALWVTTIEGKFVEDLPIPRYANWEELLKWHSVLISHESN